MSQCDWEAYKAIRLQALQESPDAFGSTYEREARFSTDHWKSRLQISPNIYDAIALAAFDNQSTVGLLSAVVHEPESETADLYQMWVAPEYRGKGIGTALVTRIKDWAVSKDIRKLQLSVTTVNTDAVALYESIGFYPVGDVEPLREGSSLVTQTMEMRLAAGEY